MTINLSRPCDACGKYVGGGVHHCPKCEIYLCFYCVIQIIYEQGKFPAECPMCGGKFE